MKISLCKITYSTFATLPIIITHSPVNLLLFRRENCLGSEVFVSSARSVRVGKPIIPNQIITNDLKKTQKKNISEAVYKK